MMHIALSRRRLLAWLTLLTGNTFSLCGKREAIAATAQSTRILIVVGPSTHPPGTHEVAAGAQVMKACLESIEGLSGISVTVVDQWPEDQSLLNQVQSVVFIGDLFPLQKLPNREQTFDALNKMMNRGCGIACIHYATGLGAADVQENGEHPLLHWLGGYFATKCKHHQSVARVFQKATIEPANAEHPVCRGWASFTIHDEPYIKNFFGNESVQPASPTIPFATSMLPPESPQQERVAWGVERPDTGRGFAVVMPHFYRNWTDENLRRLILNGVVWTTKREVPAGGVVTETPDLQRFL